MNFRIITGSDSNYFHCVIGLLKSLAPLKIHVVVLDLGLTDTQLSDAEDPWRKHDQFYLPS